MGQIVSPNPLVITIEHHEATGRTGYMTNRDFSLLGQLLILAQSQRNLIQSTPTATDPIFKQLAALAELAEFLLQKPALNPTVNPAENPDNGTTKH